MSKSINQIRTQIFFVHMLLLRIVTSHLKQVVDLSSLHCRFEVTGAHSSKGRSDCKTFCNTGNILLKDLSTHSLELWVVVSLISKPPLWHPHRKWVFHGEIQEGSSQINIWILTVIFLRSKWKPNGGFRIFDESSLLLFYSLLSVSN